MDITDDEFEYICSKANHQKIKQMEINSYSLSENDLTYEVILNFSRIKWDNLTLLILSNKYCIQPAIISVIKDVNTSLRLICPGWFRLLYVRIM